MVVVVLKSVVLLLLIDLDGLLSMNWEEKERDKPNKGSYEKGFTTPRGGLAT